MYGATLVRRFYRRTSVAPYKDRHYLDVNFPGAFDAPRGVALEVGCGCGSAAAPILRDHDGWRVVAIDFAASAVERLRARRLDRVEVLLCDVVKDALPCDGVDVVLCLFVLSSIAPGALPGVVAKLGAALKPGGLAQEESVRIIPGPQFSFQQDFSNGKGDFPAAAAAGEGGSDLEDGASRRRTVLVRFKLLSGASRSVCAAVRTGACECARCAANRRATRSRAELG